jgi:hypothetical protein
VHTLSLLGGGGGFFEMFTCTLLDSHEVLEEFLKSITSGLKRINFIMKRYTLCFYISCILPLCFCE